MQSSADIPFEKVHLEPFEQLSEAIGCPKTGQKEISHSGGTTDRVFFFMFSYSTLFLATSSSNELNFRPIASEL